MSDYVCIYVQRVRCVCVYMYRQSTEWACTCTESAAYAGCMSDIKKKKKGEQADVEKDKMIQEQKLQ